MKRSHLLIILLASVAIMVGVFLLPREASKNHDTLLEQEHEQAKAQKQKAAVAEEEPMAPAQAIVIGGIGVSPLCFVQRDAESATPSYPVKGCDAADVMLDPQNLNPMGAGFISMAYKSRDDEAIHGMIGYNYLGDVDGHKAVWIVENAGGSGVFTSLVLLDYDADKNMLFTHSTIAGGDRCNGGVSAARVVDGILAYERDMTPFDMMGLTGDPARPILQSEAAQNLPSCAACCYGRAHYKSDAFAGVSFDPRLARGLAGKDYSAAGESEKCLDNLLKLNIENGQTAFDNAGFVAFIREIEHTCLGRAEGE